MNLQTLFNAFSRRQMRHNPRRHKITRSFRSRFFTLLLERLDSSPNEERLPDFFPELAKRLQLLHGRFWLSTWAQLGVFFSVFQSEEAKKEKNLVLPPAVDALAYLLEAKGEALLDVLEQLFQVDSYLYIFDKPNELVNDINVMFAEDNLPYYLTDFIWEEPSGPADDRRRVSAYPQIIYREDEPLHVNAIEPALQLLGSRKMDTANQEYREALREYRNQNYRGCLTKCGSALESTLKLVCVRRHWPFSSTDNCSRLLKVYFDHSGLDRFFEQPILLIATIRNRLSDAHGAGPSSRSVPQHVAKYALNATASAMLLLVEEAW